MRKDRESDAHRLRDMLEAAKKIRHYAAGKPRQHFDDDELLQLALRYLVQVIGEAAYHISAELKDQNRDIPWQQITGMRHHLVHGYSDIDIEVLWIAATKNVPELMPILEQMLENESTS